MSDAIVGALIGGGFAVIGGLFGAWLLSLFVDRRAEREAKRQLSAAITAVVYEITELGATLSTVAMWSGRHPVPQRLSTSSFDQSNLVLAGGLPATLYATVNSAYQHVFLSQHKIDDWVSGGGMPQTSIDVISDAHKRLLFAGSKLSEYAQVNLGILKA